MQAIKDKGILLFAGILLFTGEPNREAGVIILCIALISACLQSYFDRSIRQKGAFLGGMIMMFVWPQSVAFLPLICYDSLLYRDKIFAAVGIGSVLPLLYGCNIRDGAAVVMCLLLSIVLADKTGKIEKISEENKHIRDSGTELRMQLERRNKELCEKQDNDIYTATLQERNRIAREIHDNVGHMLSRSILMVGALKVMNHDEQMKGYLSQLKDTLDEAMSSIRSSVHDLHDESLDLEQEVRKLVDSFSFCDIMLDYDGKERGAKCEILFYCHIKGRTLEYHPPQQCQSCGGCIKGASGPLSVLVRG